MSILLQNNNWLVADWVMKLLFEDCIELGSTGVYFKEIISDIHKSTLLYTFLLTYSDSADINKVKNLKKLIDRVIKYNQDRELEPEWNTKAFQVYLEKLKDLSSMIKDELENHIPA